jgi:hypothetical protein
MALVRVTTTVKQRTRGHFAASASLASGLWRIELDLYDVCCPPERPFLPIRAVNSNLGPAAEGDPMLRINTKSRMALAVGGHDNEAQLVQAKRPMPKLSHLSVGTLDDLLVCPAFGVSLKLKLNTLFTWKHRHPCSQDALLGCPIKRVGKPEHKNPDSYDDDNCGSGHLVEWVDTNIWIESKLVTQAFTQRRAEVATGRQSTAAGKPPLRFIDLRSSAFICGLLLSLPTTCCPSGGRVRAASPRPR